MTRRSLLAACCFLAAGSSPSVAADIVPLSGKPVKGTVVAVNAQTVSYKDDAGATVQVSVKELASVDTGEKVAAAAGSYDEVELTDGSLFRVAEFKVKGKEVLLKPAAAVEGKEPPATDIKVGTVFYWVRKANEGSNRPDWRRDVIAKRGKRDLLVLRSGDTLQPLEGTVLEGTADGVGVSFEAANGVKQDYPLTRISGGLLFNQPPPAVIPPTACKVLDVFGNSLFAQKVELAGGKVAVTTVSGATVTYPSLAAVSKFDFSQGNVKYLADLEPTVDAPPPSEGELNLPYLNNRPKGGTAFRVGGKTYAKGVWVAPDTTLTYPLNGDYREFKAMFGVDETVPEASGGVRVVVEADGRQLLAQTVVRKGGKAVEVNLNVKDAKVLKISVDRDVIISGGSLCMADARLQK